MYKKHEKRLCGLHLLSQELCCSRCRKNFWELKGVIQLGNEEAVFFSRVLTETHYLSILFTQQLA